MIWADRQQQQLLRCRLMSSTATGSPLPCFAVWKPRFPLPVSFSSLKPATRAEVSKKTRDKGAAAVALAASLCAVLVHVEALVVSQAGRAGSYPQAGEPSVLRPSPRGHLRPKGAPKSLATPVLKVFRTYASFRVALGFAQAVRQFARIREQRFQRPAEGLYVWA